MKKEKRDFISGIDAQTQKLALEQLMSGKPVFGREGALGPLLQQFLEAALEGELSAHLKEEQPFLGAPPTEETAIAANNSEPQRAASS